MRRLLLRRMLLCRRLRLLLLLLRASLRQRFLSRLAADFLVALLRRDVYYLRLFLVYGLCFRIGGLLRLGIRGLRFGIDLLRLFLKRLTQE